MSDAACGKCNYDLAGLTVAGQCPECGQYFNRRSGEGLKTDGAYSSRQARADALLARLRTIALAVLTVICISGAVASELAVGNTRWMAICLLIGSIMLLATITSFVYEKPEA